MWRRVPWRSSVSSQFSDRRRVSGIDGRRHALSVSTAELVTNRPELALLEFADRDPAPPLGGADDGRIHQLQHRAFAEGVGNVLVALMVASTAFAQTETPMPGNDKVAAAVRRGVNHREATRRVVGPGHRTVLPPTR